RTGENPCAGARAAFARGRQGGAAPEPETVHAERRAAAQRRKAARPGNGAADAGARRLSRTGVVCNLSVLPPDPATGDGDRHADVSVPGAEDQPADDDKDRAR